MPRARLDVDWRAIESARLGRKGVVFAGDTVPIMAILDRQPSDKPSVALDAWNNRFIFEAETQIAEGSLAEALPRIVAWHQIIGMESEVEATQSAVRYQLITKHTSMVAVLERAEAEKSDGLPTLAEVPQMLAAGWGGIGSSGRRHACLAPEGYAMSSAYSVEYMMSYFQADVPPPIIRSGRRHACLDAGAQPFDPDSHNSHFVLDDTHDRSDVPAFLRKKRSGKASKMLHSPSMYHLLWSIQERGLDEATGDLILFIDNPFSYSPFVEITLHELPLEIRAWLVTLVQSRKDMENEEAEIVVVLTFLACLIELVAANKKRHFRALRRAVQKEILFHPISDELHLQVLDELKKPTMREWCELDISGKPKGR